MTLIKARIARTFWAFSIGLVAASSLVAGMVQAQTETTAKLPEQKAAPSPQINVIGTGESTLLATGGTDGADGSKAQKKKVFVEFTSSERLTAQLREGFAARGFEVVPTAQEADVAVEFTAGFKFQLPRAREVVVDVGRMAEESAAKTNDSLADKAEKATRTTSTDVGLIAQGLTGSLTPTMLLGVGLLDTLGALTGAKGAFNKLIAGDERGWCLGTAEMCKNWKKYDQHVIVAVKIRPAVGTPEILRSDAATKDEQLLPDPLFQAAMSALTPRLFAAPKAPQ
jgi:hypothetical protein